MEVVVTVGVWSLPGAAQGVTGGCIAKGTSGAMQHWVGRFASKNVIAINTGPGGPTGTTVD